MKAFYSNKPQILEDLKWSKATYSYQVQELAYKLHVNQEQNNGSLICNGKWLIQGKNTKPSASAVTSVYFQ